MKPFGMIASDWRQVVKGVARGRYQLLFGAGGSAGARGGDGRPLPGSEALTRELIRDFQLEVEGDGVSLPEAYEFVEGRTDRSGRNRAAYIRFRFTNCQPTWQGDIFSARWRRLWTLNIDDVIERAVPSDARQRVRSYSWQDDFSDPNPRYDELQLIHLHGMAERVDQGEHGLVFSILEYVGATVSRHAWHSVFGSLFANDPFIVIGATLVEEFDLAEVVRRGNASRTTHGYPSILVVHKIDDLRRQLFEERGWIVVETEGEHFLNELLMEAKGEEEQLLALLPGLQGHSYEREPQVFLDQFRWLQEDLGLTEDAAHDFYGGHEPKWADILAGRDAQRVICDRVTSALAGEEVRQVLHLLHGPRGSGKSTALLRIGKKLEVRGKDVFLFRGAERPDLSSILWLLRRSKSIVLLIDGLADFSSDFGQLLAMGERDGVSVLMVATERDSRVNLVFQDVPEEYLASPSEYRLDRLSNDEIDWLIAKLSNARRLGRLTRASQQERKDYFRVAAGRDLLIGMLGLEGSSALSNRVRSEYQDDIQLEIFREVYGVVCMASSFGYPLPSGIAASAVGVENQRLVEAVVEGGALYRMVHFDDGRLYARHRAVASAVVEHGMPRSSRFMLSQSLARALSPFVTVQTIASRTLPYRIARQLMRAKVLKDWIGLEQLPAWYEGLINEFSWSSRFWEQRALGEAERGNYRKARSFAEEAIRIYRDALTLNTLGTILARMATEDGEPGSVAARELFWESVEALREAREVADGAMQHPFVTFFTYALRYASREIEATGERDPRLLEEWVRWQRRAEGSTFYRHPSTRGELKKFQERWLLLAVKSTSEQRTTSENDG